MNFVNNLYRWLFAHFLLIISISHSIFIIQHIGNLFDLETLLL